MITLTTLLIATSTHFATPVPVHDSLIRPVPVTYAERDKADPPETGGGSHTGKTIDTGALLKMNRETLWTYTFRRLDFSKSSDGLRDWEINAVAGGLLYSRNLTHHFLYELSRTADPEKRKAILRKYRKLATRRIERAKERLAEVDEPPPFLQDEQGAWVSILLPIREEAYEPYKEYYALRNEIRALKSLQNVMVSLEKRPGAGPRPN